MSRVYVASLSDYNAGVLHGEWFDLDVYSDAEELMTDIQTMVLDKSPTAAKDPFTVAEEWAIHDYEGFGGFRIGEYEDLQALIDFAEMIDAHGQPFAIWAEYQGYTLSEAPEHEQSFVDSFIGNVTVFDYACSCAEDLLQGVPDEVARYFDYQQYARDMVMAGDVFEVVDGGDSYLFRSNV
ncbi:antirestriction protein ArdA [Rhodococcus rhodochrous]|uniref:antirestriction protein ArdA n=1 Tax=Rhodococcus rhodochrous TaxID=1829 RepID=UPI001E43347F|nr:antirestriction protein ArdA [Rhodococcus rhodochrous]MCB8911077.1 antirestriction protein ArdA [Rhodococcus rhodochrous]